VNEDKTAELKAYFMKEILAMKAEAKSEAKKLRALLSEKNSEIETLHRNAASAMKTSKAAAKAAAVPVEPSPPLTTASSTTPATSSLSSKSSTPTVLSSADSRREMSSSDEECSTEKKSKKRRRKYPAVKRKKRSSANKEALYAISLIGKARLEERYESLKSQRDNQDVLNFYND
jgi:Tfp pilus assembly protein PilV